jgi:E3 ubiquitin-protein ligase TRIP12
VRTEYIHHHGELFPLPLPRGAPKQHVAAVCARFRFLGRLMAAACRDGFCVPLPLSRHFLHLARGGSLSHAALPPPSAVGGVVYAYAAVAANLAAADCACASGETSDAERRLRYEAEAEAEFACARLGMGSPLSLRDTLAAACTSFVCPLTGAPLCVDGGSRDVTVDNLQEFVSLVAQFWLADGVSQQASAFRLGVSDLCQDADVLLAPFSLTELQTLLCGTRTVEWSQSELLRALRPAAPYTRDSAPYQLLVAELLRMEHEGCARFLTFVTACPHLPPSGVGALAISVHPQQGGKMLPSAHTCTSQLYLPEYPTAEALRSGLETAFANTEAGGLHEHSQ